MFLYNSLIFFLLIKQIYQNKSYIYIFLLDTRSSIYMILSLLSFRASGLCGFEEKALWYILCKVVLPRSCSILLTLYYLKNKNTNFLMSKCKLFSLFFLTIWNIDYSFFLFWLEGRTLLMILIYNKIQTVLREKLPIHSYP